MSPAVFLCPEPGGGKRIAPRVPALSVPGAAMRAMGAWLGDMPSALTLSYGATVNGGGGRSPCP